MSTAQTLINSAFSKCGALAAGEVPNGTDSVDALATLNQMLESWRLEGLMAFATLETDIAWAGAVPVKTIGTGGAVNITRPVGIDHAIWSDAYGNLSAISIIEADRWLTIYPANQQSIPEYLYYETSHPLGILHLWPVPNLDGTLKILSRTPIGNLELGDTILLPPGYERAIIYNLGVELSVDYGSPLNQITIAIATESKAAIKRQNLKVGTLSMPTGVPGIRPHRSIING